MTDENAREEIIEIVSHEIQNAGFAGSYNVEEFDSSPRLKAYTNLRDKYIHIFYTRKYADKNPDGVCLFARDATRHEMNHHGYREFKGCPGNLESHTEFFLNPMSEILIPKGFSLDDVIYASNALQDTILHSELSSGRNSLEGICVFFKEVGDNCDKSQKGRRKFTPFYEAHVKLNMNLWGNRKQKHTLQKFYTHNREITEVLKKFSERIKDLNILRESDWAEISKIYAEEFFPLMSPGYALPLFNHSGAGTKGNNEEHQNQEGNYFDRKAKAREGKQSVVLKAYKREQETPQWIDRFEAMDIIYESLARKLNIVSKSYTDARKIPLVHFGKRDFDPSKDNLKQIVFGFDDSGSLALKKKRHHLDLEIRIKRSEHGFPSTKFGLLDTSASMAEDINGKKDTGNKKIIPWGDKSKYHYALLGWYGLLEYLRQNHLLSQSNISLANFSSETIIGNGLTKAKKTALNPQWGITQINQEALKYFFEGSNSLTFTISDGQIQNWDQIKEQFIESAKKHQYFHLQIGTETQTTKNMKEEGLRVEYVTNVSDLANKTIDLTDSLLRVEQKTK